MSKIIIFVVVAILVLTLAGGLIFWFYFKKDSLKLEDAISFSETNLKESLMKTYSLDISQYHNAIVTVYLAARIDPLIFLNASLEKINELSSEELKKINNEIVKKQKPLLSAFKKTNEQLPQIWLEGPVKNFIKEILSYETAFLPYYRDALKPIENEFLLEYFESNNILTNIVTDTDNYTVLKSSIFQIHKWIGEIVEDFDKNLSYDYF